MGKKILKGLCLEDYRHPAERSAFSKLAQMDLVGKSLDWIAKKAIEEFVEIEEMGTNIQISDSCLSDINSLVSYAAQISDTQNTPRSFVKWCYDFYLTTNGIKNPIIVINSGFFDLLTSEEQLFMLGHEMGHIRSQHLRFLILCKYWYSFADSIPGSSLLMIPLFYWSRMTDLTADRVALLTCQNIDIAITTMMKLSGVPRCLYNQMDPKSFYQQIDDFRLLLKNENKLIEKISVLDNAAPWLVNRASELLKWYESGEYNQIIQKYGM